MVKADFGDFVTWVIGLLGDFQLFQDVSQNELQMVSALNFHERRVDVVLLQELHHVLQFGEVSRMHIMHFRGDADGFVVAKPDVHTEITDGFGVCCVNVFVPEVEPQVAGCAAVWVVREAEVFVRGGFFPSCESHDRFFLC